MDAKQLKRAAQQAGIIDSFINMDNQLQHVSAHTKTALLAAMGRDTPRPASSTALPAVLVFRLNEPVSLLPKGRGNVQWELQLEEGARYCGQAKLGATLSLQMTLPLGYHQLVLIHKTHRTQCRLIIAPASCYRPAALWQGKKLWGACVQLYTLRSQHNWGIGDFADLRQMVNHIGHYGGAFIGLNPIHALYPAVAESASPYSPSSRRWLNIVYLAVYEIEEFQQSPQAQAWWQLSETQQRLEQVRSCEYVDYSQVMALKLEGLKLAWSYFQQQPADTARKQDFYQFIQQGGGELYQQGVFDTLQQHLGELDQAHVGWPAWPEAYRNPQSEEVQAFSQRYRDEVMFFIWLQWLADRQFAHCYEESLKHEMPIGLYRDLAVGVAQGGAETWANRSLYCLDASIGAPPDKLGPQGQNWQLPPIDPNVLQGLAYQPFIDLLRANMRCCGALRIDHVLGLLRLWWVPLHHSAAEGAYVRYPIEDLLAILALESHRNSCMVIGEDLGTVPQEIVSILQQAGVYSYKVLYFERDGQGNFRAPDEYKTQAMATISTHDLPTLRGYWQGEDLQLGETLGFYPSEQSVAAAWQQRMQSKQQLLDALHRHGCMAKNAARRAAGLPMSYPLSRGIQRYLASSGSELLGLQPEDWLDMSTPVNVPGTDKEYPNWRRKLSLTLEELFADQQITRLIKDLNNLRQQASLLARHGG
jgi:4-alpha-glucanotransferase